MTGVRNSLTRTQSDAIGEVVSLESCHIVLETSPPDYVEKISRYLESCVGQKGQDEAHNGPADAESESGDSLFITQKPVPAAERSGRRRTYNFRSKPASSRDLEECEEDTSSSTSHDDEYKTDTKRRKMKKYKLPKYNFPFLSEQTLKFSRTMLPVKNKSLINYMMGGFFKCVRELRLDPKSSLPTVDTDGEDISPLSEEGEDRSEVEDIKVVERKRLVKTVSLSKAKRQQTWSSPLKQPRKREARNAGQGTARGKQTKMLHKNTVKASTSKAVPMSSVTQSSDDGESSRGALVQRERKDQHAISDRNFLAQTGKPKTRHRAHEDALHLQKASEEDNESTVCEPRKLLQCQSTEKGREASILVTEPQTDVCNETKEKKRKTKKKDKGNHESVEERTGQSQEEPDNILTQQEGDVPDSKQKKKKREKDKSAAENVGQEGDGSVESDVRVEDSNMEDGSKEKRKKRKRSEDVEQLESGAAVEPLNGDTEIQKRKKKRKKEVMVVEHEEEEASNMSQMSTERLEESGNCLENAAASQKTLDSGYVKRKKHKKMRQSSANDATQDGGEGVDVSDCLEGSATSTKGMSLKQKRKNSSHTPEENEKADNNLEGLEDNEENAELVTKKKKKKSEIFSRDVSEDKVAQSDDSVSVREKKKERTSSFLVADAEENNARVHGEAEKPAVSAGDVEKLNDVVMKKKKKRKMSVAQDSVEKDHERDFEEPKKSALPETTDTGVKKERKQTGSESESVRERLEAHVGFSPTDEAVVLKKKKKYEDLQEGSPPASGDVESVALNTCSSVSHEIKGEHGHSAEISHDSSTTSDRASKEASNVLERASASSETPGNQVLNDTRDKKKKKKMKSTDTALLEGNSLMESAELESREIKKKEKKQRNKQSTVPSMVSETSISTCKMLSSENIVKNKHRKVKRRLHNANEDFLSDC